MHILHGTGQVLNSSRRDKMIKNDFLHNRKGEPVFLTGLQCHNSSSGTEMIDRTIKAIKLHGGNLLEAPALCYVSGGPVGAGYLEGHSTGDHSVWAGHLPAEYGAIGISCFGAESGIAGDELLPEAKEMAISMNVLSSLAPLLIKYRGTGRVHAVTQAEFSQWQYIKTEEYHITARFLSNDPKPQHYFGSRINVNASENKACMTCRGRCLLIDCGEGEFYLAGAGVCFSFLRRPDPGDEIPYAHLTSQLSGQLNFLSIEEGHFEGGRWVCEYKRNGDEANYQLYVHEGAVVRVRLNQRSPFVLEPPGDSEGFCERP